MKKHLERSGERGIALVPAILVVSGMAIFLVALLTAVMSGRRTVVHQNEDYHVSSAVESVAMLAAEDLWSDYIAGQGGQASDIHSFREFLGARGIENAIGDGPPAPDAGTSLLAALALPVEDGRSRFNDVNVDAVQVVRRDTDADSTQLFLTVSASTTRGDGIVNPVFNRAVQQVYTVEPEDFPGGRVPHANRTAVCGLGLTRTVAREGEGGDRLLVSGQHTHQSLALQLADELRLLDAGPPCRLGQRVAELGVPLGSSQAREHAGGHLQRLGAKGHLLRQGPRI